MAGLLCWNYLSTALSQVRFLSVQEVGRTAPLEGVLVKEEKVVRSPAAGRLHLAVPDGQRLEVGARAGQVTASEQDSGEVRYDLHTPWAGILCTHLDGLENVLSPGNLDVLELPGADKIVDKTPAEGGRVEKGQPVFKIVDNLSPVIFYTSLKKEDFSSGLADRPGWLEAAWEEQTLMVKPAKLVDRGDHLVGFFLLSGYPERLVHHRKVRFTVTVEKLKGLLVPGRAIVHRDGQPGVYLAVKRKATWVPVKIEGELAGQVAISGRGLNEGSRYVSNPILAREGWLVE